MPQAYNTSMSWKVNTPSKGPCYVEWMVFTISSQSFLSLFNSFHVAYQSFYFDKIFLCQQLKSNARLDMSSAALMLDAQDLSLNRHT